MTDETKDPGIPPGEGIYPNTPKDVYVAWRLPSSGSPGVLRKRTLLALKQDIDAGPKEDDSAARFLGTVVHSAILEPDDFEARYLRLPTPDPEKHRKADKERSKSENPASTKDYKEECRALADANPNKVLVDAGDYAKGIRMRDRVLRHPEVSACLKAPGLVEAAIVVKDPTFGVTWKLSPDKIVDPVAAVLSVKTTRNARPDIFTHDFFKFGYHMKEAIYRMLLPHAGIEVRNTWMLAIETEGAGEIGFFNIPDVYLEDMGKPLALKYMERIARALEADKWPGIPSGMVDLFPPFYAPQRVEDELGEAGRLGYEEALELGNDEVES